MLPRVLHSECKTSNDGIHRSFFHRSKEGDALATVEDKDEFQRCLNQTPFFANGRRRYQGAAPVVPKIDIASDKDIATQTAFGKTLDDLVKGN